MATTSVQDTIPLFYHIERRFPPELKRLICSYIPISVLRKVRKIRQDELPKNYKIAKALNDQLYKIYYGYKLDIDITPIKDRVNKYLKNNTEINSKKYFEKDMYGGNIIEDRIYVLLSSKKWDIIEMLGY